MAEQNTFNKLINEKSPYLLQHAQNPVDWFPWGDEAFEKARLRDRPVFMSIGYSTCHWCHVMAHESFEDAQVAKLLNENYVSIKVDREERPDVDAVYMSACQAMTGHGGWPLTVFMTADQKPFYTATYIPKNSVGQSAGFIELLEYISDFWKNNREKIYDSADSVAQYLESRARSGLSPATPSERILNTAVTLLERGFDPDFAGFSPAPKFPSPHIMLFLLSQYRYKRDEKLLKMAEHTLICMYRGGIFDHIGGGFSRYSTDRRWLVPHFEKMLYDNALLTLAYTECFFITLDPLYKEIVYSVCGYVFRKLTDENGGFYCGEDADSEGTEGKFYVFSRDEIISVLGDEAGKSFNEIYGITSGGNFEGKSIPNLLDNPDFRNAADITHGSAERLRAYRKQRARLFKDDKVLTSWNALEITALCRAGTVFGDGGLISAAKKAESFLRQRLVNPSKPDGLPALFARYRDGEAAFSGTLDDYAFYTLALISLFDACFDAEYLGFAVKLAASMVEKFFDTQNGGFYLYSSDETRLISRPKELYDGAMPSGNSAAALALELLFVRTGEERWRALSEKQLSFVAGQIESYPSSACFALLAVQNTLFDRGLLVCVMQSGQKIPEITALRSKMRGNTAILVKTPENSAVLSKIAPFSKHYPIPESSAMFYFCENGACLSPVDSPDKLPARLFK